MVYENKAFGDVMVNGLVIAILKYQRGFKMLKKYTNEIKRIACVQAADISIQLGYIPNFV